MSLPVKVSLIVLAMIVVTLAVELIPRHGGLKTSPSAQREFEQLFKQQNKLLDALLVRPPHAALQACGAFPAPSLSHAELVRIANCLHRKGFVTVQTVAAVTNDQRLGVHQQQVVGLQAKSDTTSWWYWLIWATGLALIAFVVFRHRRRPPNTSAPTQT
jgi:hypothetical protein